MRIFPWHITRLGFACAAVLAALFCACLTARAADQTVGNVTNVTLSVDGTNGNVTANFWIDNGGEAAVTPIAADVVRVQYYDTYLWPKEEPMIAQEPGFWPTISNSVSFTDQGATYLIQTPQLAVVVTKSPFKVDFRDPGGYDLLADDHSEFNSNYVYTAQSGWTSGDFKVKCFKTLPPNQAFFGLGEYGGPLNRMGREMECWNEGTYNWTEYNNPEYENMPFFYGVQPANGPTNAFVYGIFFDNPCRPLFRFGTQETNQFSFEAGDGQLDYFFFGGGTNHTMASVIDRYSELTGRPTMLPKWGLGYHLSRFSYNNQSWVEYIADTATESNIPLDAVYLDIDYMSTNADNDPTAPNVLHQLTFDSNFPDPAGMASHCAAEGVKLVPLIEPLLETEDPFYNEENTNYDFIKDNNSDTVVGNIYLGPVSWFDFTSTPMQHRWQGKIDNWLNSVPLAGIWNDIDEPEDSDGQIPYNGLLWLDGRYGLSTTDSRRQWSNEHNYFGMRCAATSYGALLAENPNKRPFVLSRSGNCGIQRYALSWSGDTAANWTYASNCIPFGLSAMISGQAWYGHDLGGFVGTVTGELLTRWHEWGALLPLMRNHSQKGDNVWPDGNQGREPWRFPDPYQSAMRNCIQLRYELMPYLYTLAYNATQTGRPMNTPTVFDYYADPNTAFLNDYEFNAGSALLAAPVSVEGATTRTVYLPYAPGVGWYHWWSNVRYNGGTTVTVNAPLGELPLFARSDAIIPMGPVMQYTGQFLPGYLNINCWPETSSSFTLFEDAGDGWDYTNGVYASVTFNSARTPATWDFSVGARQGSYNPGHTNYNVYVNNPQAVQDVTLDGAPLAEITNLTAAPTGWLLTTQGQLVVKMVDNGAAQAVHVDWNTNVVIGSTYASITCAGNFQNPHWNTAASNMVQVTAHNWQFDTSFADETNFQFKFAADGSWATNWGDSGQSQFTVPLSGTAQSGGGNISANGTFNGTYRFTFNDQTLVYSLTPLLASPWATMTLAGTFNGWNTGLTNMTLVTNSQWQCNIAFAGPTNIQFKFAANGTWTNNWGDSHQTLTNPPFAGVSQSSGGNISADIPTNGAWQFSFNDQTLAYSLQPATVVAAVPPAIFGPIFSGNALFFSFTNVSGASFTVLTSTNLTQPLSNWTVLGTATESPAGFYQFTDVLPANVQSHYYRVRSP